MNCPIGTVRSRIFVRARLSRTAATSARDEQGQEVVTMKEELSALIDGELQGKVFKRILGGSGRTRVAQGMGYYH